MALRVTILDGPNLDLLGVREPHIYSTTTLRTCRHSKTLERVKGIEPSS